VFDYNDGNDTENYLLGLIKASSDLGTGSGELVKGIRDWPSLYHLSPQRADLLRPFSGYLKGKSVLEIGSGCGAITRFLGETASSVVAVEGSARRASITAERCRDLPNVRVVRDNFDAFEWAGTFDVVTLIGVLEYSNLYIGGLAPSASLLEKAAEFLAPGGVLLIAIENKLGTKYWAGAPEDHTGKAYYGIENRYTSATAVTYGKQELTTLLQGAGFSSTEFFYPFPDYKLPTVILRDGHMEVPGFNIANLLMPNADYFQEERYFSSFSLPLALKQLVANKLVGDLSNSFLVVAGKTRAGVVPENTMGYTYSSMRKRPFAKENRFVLQEDGQMSVHRAKVHGGAVAAENPWIRQYIEKESYLEGDIHFIRFIEIVSTQGWSIGDLVDWARPYYQLLKGFVRTVDGKELVEGRYVDAVPFNVLQNRGRLCLFDLEWEITEMLPLHYVLCRGLYYCFSRVSVVYTPAAGTPERFFGLVEAIMEALGVDIVGVIDDFIERETRYFPYVGFLEHNVPMDSTLSINLSNPGKVIAIKDGLIEALQAENDRFKEITDWYRRTYEDRSLAGLLLTRFFARNR
jgi:SAM-dependent methyltransferase